MKKLLISGFEPFGGEKINPSWEAVECLPSEINGYALTKLLLPVTFGAVDILISAAELVAPAVIICIGQAGGRAEITPELVGINLRHASMPDNCGNQPEDEAIIPGGAAAYFSTLPVRRMARAISELGIPSSVSYSAGTYVCNETLYTLLSRFDGTATRVGFIHIPYSKEQNKETCMDMSDIVKGLIAALNNID